MGTAIAHINPPQLHEAAGYHHVTIVEAGRLAFIAGHCPLDRSGAVVGPNDVETELDLTSALPGV